MTPLSKPKLPRLLGKLSPAQKRSIRLSVKRINVWEGAIRSSKTVASIIRLIQLCATTVPGDGFILGRTERTVYRNVIRPLMTYVGKDASYNRAYGELKLWGRVLYVIGANDKSAESKLRGMTAAIGYADEVTLLNEEIFGTAMGRLSIAGATMLVTTNPDGPNHWFKKNWLDRRDELDMAVFHFTLDDNIHLPPEYVKQIKLEYVGVWFKRYILGLWVAAEGLVHDCFDEDVHICKKPKAEDITGCIVACDYGTTNPTVFLCIGHDRPGKRVWCLDEMVYDSAKNNGKQKTDSEYADDLEKFAKRQLVRPSAIVIDPSAASFKVEVKKRHVGAVVDADNSVLDGIRNQSAMLKKGIYKICENCVQTIEDYYAYLWDKKATERGEDAPLKKNDHTKDAERYGLKYILKSLRLNYTNLWR